MSHGTRTPTMRGTDHRLSRARRLGALSAAAVTLGGLGASASIGTRGSQGSGPGLVPVHAAGTFAAIWNAMSSLSSEIDHIATDTVGVEADTAGTRGGSVRRVGSGSEGGSSADPARSATVTSLAPTTQPSPGTVATGSGGTSTGGGGANGQGGTNVSPSTTASAAPSTQAVASTDPAPTTVPPTTVPPTTVPPTTVPTTTTAARPPNLVQAGNSKTNCIYANWGSDGWGLSGIDATLAAVEQQTGVNYQCIETFSDADPQWSDWVDPWVERAQYGFKAWLAADPTDRTVVLSQDLIPQSEANSADPLIWESACDQGQFNAYATQLAQNLVSNGFGNSVIRLGMEMNGPWEMDFVGTSTQEQQAWANCFAEEVTAMRAVPGADFLFDWDPNTCYENIPLLNYYPGNAYVDLIGADAYDASCQGQLPLPPSASDFTSLYNEQLGLGAITSFAESQGKPMSLPEWGTTTGTYGLGDDGYYVAGIGSWVASNDVAFQCWFDNGNDGILSLDSSNPNSLAAYRQAFG